MICDTSPGCSPRAQADGVFFDLDGPLETIFASLMMLPQTGHIDRLPRRLRTHIDDVLCGSDDEGQATCTAALRKEALQVLHNASLRTQQRP